MLRIMFINRVRNSAIYDVSVIQDEFKEDFCDDLVYRFQHGFDISENLGDDPHLNYELYLIGEELAQLKPGGTRTPTQCLETAYLPLLRHDWARYIMNRLIVQKLDYDEGVLVWNLGNNFPRFNEEQRITYNQIIFAVERGIEDFYFFLQGAGGTGKIFLYQVLCDYFRSQGKIVLCVALTGITVLFLLGDTTAHSRFKILLDITADFSCMIRKRIDLAAFFKRTDLIIWDEAPMQHRYAVEAVDKFLQDIRNSAQPFDGMFIIFGDD